LTDAPKAVVIKNKTPKAVPNSFTLVLLRKFLKQSSLIADAKSATSIKLLASLIASRAMVFHPSVTKVRNLLGYEQCLVVEWTTNASKTRLAEHILERIFYRRPATMHSCQ